jgi:NifB/MoaA-like Fe-S oxidoreductase
VPYGYTRFARQQQGFSAEQAKRLIEQCAMRSSKVQLADEFFLLAGEPLPSATYYGDYPQYEDGIGMLRSFVDEWGSSLIPPSIPSPHLLWGLCEDNGPRNKCGDGSECGDGNECGDGSECGDATAMRAPLLVTSEAFAPILRELTGLKVIAITNNFFGGNVNVAGLITAQDIIEQLPTQLMDSDESVALPSVMFNDDGLTLDDMTAAELAQALKRQVDVVPCTAQGLLDYLSRSCSCHYPSLP